MDLYEALKSGTSAEELLKTFHKDLDAANDRIAAEKEAAAKAAEHDNYIAYCRKMLAEAIIDYAEALVGEELDENEFSVEDIVKILIDAEDNIHAMLNVYSTLDKALAKTKSENKKPVGIKITHYTDDDNDIIARFLKSLK